MLEAIYFLISIFIGVAIVKAVFEIAKIAFSVAKWCAKVAILLLLGYWVARCALM